MEDVTITVSSQPWRPRRYADGKPRPLFRGVLHGVGSISFIVGAVVAAIGGDVGLCLGLIGKFATYSASATFHLYPFKSVVGVTNAFIIDLIFVPASACGSIAPFVATTHDSIAREATLAGCVLILNAALVIWQTRGQIGLKTRDDRSEAPRSIVVALYSIWVFVYLALIVGIRAEWCVCLGFFLLAAGLSQPVTKAHELEPLSSRVPWHRAGVWSFHEDFHLALALGDAAWLVLALRWIASGRVRAMAF